MVELFERYTSNEKILVVTHDGILNSIKRNFIKDCNNEWTNNLRILKINNENYEYYKENNMN